MTSLAGLQRASAFMYKTARKFADEGKLESAIHWQNEAAKEAAWHMDILCNWSKAINRSGNIVFFRIVDEPAFNGMIQFRSADMDLSRFDNAVNFYSEHYIL